MTYAKNIIKRAKANIIDHIRFEVSLIDLIVNKHETADEEPYTSEEDWPYSPSVEVDVDNSYLDVEDCTSETRAVVKVSSFGKGIIVETDEGDELCGETIDIDDLAAISDCLDMAYKKLAHK
jgi:hypothetical protein